MDHQKASSDGEDIPSDFFDDFAKEDFIEGLSVVDEWDNDESERPREEARFSDDVEGLRQVIDEDRREETRRLSRGPSEEDRRRSNSEARMDDFIKPGSRRDPNKTNEAIKRDKEMKVKQHIAKHLEATEDLRPPGTELDDFYEASKKIEKNEIKIEEEYHSPPREVRESSGKSSPKPKLKLQERKGSMSPVRHRSPGKLQAAAERFYGRHEKFQFSAGRFRRGSGRFRNHIVRHREYGRHHESPPRYERHYSNRKSPSFYRHAPGRYEHYHRSRSPQHHSGYRKERRYPSPRGSPPRMSRRSRSSRSPRHHYDRSRSRSPRRSSEYSKPHKEHVPPYPYPMGPQPQYPVPINYNPGMSVNPPMPPAQYSIPQPYPTYNPYPYDMNPPQPVPAPIPAPVNPGIGPTVPSPRQLVNMTPTTGPSSTVAIKQEPVDALAKLVADGILSHEDYLKLAPNKGAQQQCQQLDVHAKIDVLKRCNSAVSKLDELVPSNRLIVDRFKKTETPKAIAPQFFSPLKKKPIAEFIFTEISATAVAQKNKQIIDTIVSTLDLYDLVGRVKRNSNTRDAAVQTTGSHCDKCVIREATMVMDAGTSIDQEHFSSSTHTQVVGEDLQSSRAVFNASGSTSDGSAPISFAHMTPAQLVSQLVARAKTLKQSDRPSESPPNQYQGRQRYDDRRGPPNYRNNYNQYRY